MAEGSLLRTLACDGSIRTPRAPQDRHAACRIVGMVQGGTAAELMARRWPAS
jgi:hypothetical protein